MKRLYNRVNNRELKQRLEVTTEARTTLSFYRYYQLPDPAAFRHEFYLGLQNLGVLGRIYVAQEGINGQISVPTDRLPALRDYLESIAWLQRLRLNIAIEDDGKSFFKLTIKVREKLVADGLHDETFDVTRRGRHLSAAEVNALLDQPNTVVVDMRNHYESEVGYFERAIRPQVETFREALPLVEKLLQNQKNQPVIMYCTGGIRCEKASAYYLHQGFQEVYMVDGGIIEYARQCAEQGLPNRFIGKNFVFDERLGERISTEVVAHCHQCGAPCDTHKNCANDACHLLFIQCPACAEKYQQCCSQKCADFRQLPAEEQQSLRKTLIFNGTKFGKGRYKAQRQDAPLDLG